MEDVPTHSFSSHPRTNTQEGGSVSGSEVTNAEEGESPMMATSH